MSKQGILVGRMQHIVKTPRTLQILFWLLAAVVCVLPFHAFFSTWAGMYTGQLLFWKVWKELLLLVGILLLLGWLLADITRLRVLLRQPFVVAAVVFALVVALVTAVNSSELQVAPLFGGLAMTLRYVAAAVLAFAVVWFAPELWQRWRQPFVRYFLAASAVVAFFGLWQVSYMPADFMQQFGYEKGVSIAPLSLISEKETTRRAFGTLRGPNEFGAFMVLPLVLAMLTVVRPWKKYALLALFSTAIVASSGRSVWLGMIAGFVVLLGAVAYEKKISLRRIIVSGVGVVLALLALLFAAFSIPSLRLQVFHSSPQDTSLTTGSTDDHLAATAAGAERVLADPLGCGAGCAGPASVYGDEPRIAESYYVQVAEEYGVVGLGVLLVLFVVVMRGVWARRSDRLALWVFICGVTIGVVGLLLHIWSDDPLSITWWLLAGAVLASQNTPEKKLLKTD